MSYLFNYTIDGWASWGNVFQSIAEFYPIIERIFYVEGLQGADEISNLTPGTNAVFKVGPYVVKIYAPPQSGFDTEKDYTVELFHLCRMSEAGVGCPRLVASGVIHDKYLFRYIVMDHIDAREANEVLHSYTYDQKEVFVRKFNSILLRLHQKAETDEPLNLIDRAIDNERWHIFNHAVRKQVEEALKGLAYTELYHVHGDLTGDNVLIDDNDNIILLDFADSVVGPLDYELPPIILDLFKCDHELVHFFIGSTEPGIFIDRLFNAILMHDFGGNIVRDFYIVHTGSEVSGLNDIYCIKDILKSVLF